MLPVIKVDDSTCGVALDCRLCLLACPTHVLGLGTNVGPQKYQETDPSHFIVRGVRFQLCTVCGKCEEVCPHGAIQVSVDQGATA
jgi:formate hydrogenlyase subunit 6/NADH:ubiquinone oxidoreductase subunit I